MADYSSPTRQLSWQEKLQGFIGRNLPSFTAKVINNLAYGLVLLSRFIGQLIKDALGK